MYRFSTIGIVILFLLCANLGITQKLPTIVPPSPTVANLMQFEEVPINNYTGQPNISIPIYSKSIGNNSGVNIGLNYNTQGIQIENRSGWTGTGWTLFAGGSISRTVRDIPDEAVKGSTGFSIKTGVLQNGDYWNYDNLSGSGKAEFNWKAVGSSVDKYDINLDLYQFNFLSYSGRFVIVKENGVLVPKIISRNSSFKIELTYNPTTYVISKFTITDPNGYQYVFNVVEATTTTFSTESMIQGSSSSTSGSADTYTVNSAWHLSQVLAPNDIELAEFNYQTVQETYNTSPSYVENRITTYTSNMNDMLQNAYNRSIMEPKEIVFSSVHSTPTKKLSSIVFRDNTSITFTRIVNHPEYVSGSSSLKDIIIKDANNIENKRFTFTYQTSAGRLWLSKVSEIAGGITLDTELTYNDKSNLPYFGTESDAWGYNSGIGMASTGCTSSNFDEELITKGLLTKIKYPTNGIKEFTYEHNTYSYFGNEAIGYSDYIKNPKNKDNTSLSVNSFVYQNGVTASPVTIGTFTLDYEQDIYVSSLVTVTSSNSQYINDHIVTVSSGSFYRQFSLSETCGLIKNAPSGTYTLAFAPYINEYQDSYTITGNYQVNYSEEASTMRQEMIGGGVRIKNVIFKDTDPTQLITKKINYVYLDETTTQKSSGVVDSQEGKLERNYSLNTSRYLFSSTENNVNGFFPTTIWYDVTQKGANVQLSQGGYIGYRNVKVYETNNGYSIYNYTTAYDYPSPSATFILPNATPAPNLDYKRGLLLKQRIYDKSNRILKQVENTAYDFVEDFMFKSRYVYKPKTCRWMQFYNTWSFYVTVSEEVNIPYCAGEGIPSFPCLTSFGYCGPTPITQLNTNFNTGWAQLKEKITKEYFYDGATQRIAESRQVYSYNTTNYQISEKHDYYKEKGIDVHYETEYFYSVDGAYSTTASVRNKMITLNKVNDVLETVAKKNNDPVSKTNTIYYEFEADLILPKEVKTSKGTNTPVTRIEFDDYDTYGNPREVSKADGLPISYIWGYNEEYPIAKIENASYSDVITAIGTLPSSYNTLVEIQARSNNDDDTCTDSGSCDEKNLRMALNALRDALPNAMVTTYTYDPLVGVTSTTDPKGYTMYYEYDSFNRLEFVKDANGKLISEHKYNYKNQ